MASITHPSRPLRCDLDRLIGVFDKASEAKLVMVAISRRLALGVISSLVALLACGLQSATNPLIGDAVDYALLEKPAFLDIVALSGSLKETRQVGQDLIWRPLGRPAVGAFRVSNLSVGLLATRGRVTMTFSGSISSLGYKTADEAQVHVILRTKGGAALYTSVISMAVRCTDNNQTLHPPTSEVPDNIASIVFTNVGLVEVTEHNEANARGLKVERCS